MKRLHKHFGSHRLGDMPLSDLRFPATRLRRGVRALALLAVAALGAVGAAQADIHSKAKVSHFGYRLVDLRPEDGIAPGIEFLTAPELNGQTWGVARYGLSDARFPAPNAPLEAEDSAADAFKLFTPMALEVSNARVGSVSRISGSVLDHSLSFVARGSLRSGAGEARRFAGTSYGAWAEPAAVWGTDNNRFRLAPYTQVVWSGDVFMQVRTTVGSSQRVKEDAASRLLLTLGPAGEEPVAGLVRYLDVYAFKPRDKRWEGSFSMALSNDGAETMTGALQLTVGVGGFLRDMAAPGFAPAVSPVPEPRAWALMLCGLGMVAVAARRRR